MKKIQKLFLSVFFLVILCSTGTTFSMEEENGGKEKVSTLQGLMLVTSFDRLKKKVEEQRLRFTTKMKEKKVLLSSPISPGTPGTPRKKN